ncbi:hypothetical protein GMA12_11425 [Kocuria sediminis]|uniref:Uncharacterized protein n=1 Tax=Kocuria sediminis TaxID=1038857 RepID=A0A6N8GS27_9MICC|nr:hypothetical protein [Kocuria sediminis]
MIVDLEGGMTCIRCRTVFDAVPLSTAVQPGWPAGITLVPASALPVAERRSNVFWTEDSWPTTCALCNPAGWVRCQFPEGSSFSPS